MSCYASISDMCPDYQASLTLVMPKVQVSSERCGGTRTCIQVYEWRDDLA